MGSDDPTPKDKEASTEESAVTLCAALFGETLAEIEVRELALALAARGVQVHLKPRWLEETGVSRAERS